MSGKRILVSEQRLSGSAVHGRRRERKFVLLAIVLGLVLAVVFGAILYTINLQGRI